MKRASANKRRTAAAVFSTVFFVAVFGLFSVSAQKTQKQEEVKKSPQKETASEKKPISNPDYPDKIRGYKVYNADIDVKNASGKPAGRTEKENAEAFVTVGDPTLADISLAGITFEVSAEIDALDQSGKVDFLAFHDFRVNDLAVEIEEYKNSFEFKKNQPIVLPAPARIFLGTTQTLRGAVEELKNSKTEWRVTGTVFVFGRFKKFGLTFKRVVPVRIDVVIKNPLKSEKLLSASSISK